MSDRQRRRIVQSPNRCEIFEDIDVEGMTLPQPIDSRRIAESAMEWAVKSYNMGPRMAGEVAAILESSFRLFTSGSVRTSSLRFSWDRIQTASGRAFSATVDYLPPGS